MEKENIVELFNEKFPPGATIRWRPIQNGNAKFRDYTVLYAATDFNGQAVAWFRERSGKARIEPGFVDYEN